MTVRLSIAMTTYNGAQHLLAQLESFARQTRLPDELVVCDDCSSDGTAEVLQEFARAAPFPVRIVRNLENLGHERNFGQAIDLCVGDIIFLADQDDAWNRDKLEVVAAEFADGDPLLVVNDVMITDGDLHPLGRTVLEQTRAAGVLGQNAKSLTLGCATAFASRLRTLVSPIPALDYGHDSWIHDFTEILGGRRVIPRVLQLYRRHGANASNWAFNSAARATPLDVMKPSSGKDLTGQYDKRIAALRLMKARVESLGAEAFAELRGARSYDHVLGALSKAIVAVENRKGVFRTRGFARKLLALRMVAGGHYRHFLGWRSFMKDLIR